MWVFNTTQDTFSIIIPGWKNLKWAWHRSWSIWERRVRKRGRKSESAAEAEAWESSQEGSRSTGRQGTAGQVTAACHGRQTWDVRCSNPLACIHQMLDFYLILRSTSGSKRNWAFAGAPKPIGIFTGSLNTTPLLLPQPVSAPGRLFTQRTAGEGKRKAS